MRIQYSLFPILFFFSTACLSQKSALNAGAIKQDIDKAITLSGFPSRDTASITFYKKDIWYILVEMQNPLNATQPQVCRTCDAVFTDTFFDNLFTLKTDKPNFDCRIVTDTIIDGKQLIKIDDFYAITDLERETIAIKKGKQASSVSYMAPRYALKYCKNNTNRVAFIRVSDRLLKIK